MFNVLSGFVAIILLSSNAVCKFYNIRVPCKCGNRYLEERERERERERRKIQVNIVLSFFFFVGWIVLVCTGKFSNVFLTVKKRYKVKTNELGVCFSGMPCFLLDCRLRTEQLMQFCKGYFL